MLKDQVLRLKRSLLILKSRFFSLLLRRKFFFANKGFCPCCDRKVVFVAFDNWLRDSFYCSYCFSIPRQRALILIVEKYFPQWKELSIHESSPGQSSLTAKLSKYSAKYVPTHYFPGKTFGTIVNGFRNEDLESQTFEDESFDIIITQDVMEHIYNPELAIKEIARTLKKNGAHIFTVPIINKHKKSEVWATKGSDGKPIFLKEPEYHLNPVDPMGSPVTMHWGYDIIDFIKEKSGLDTTIEYIDNLYYGIRAEYIEVLVSMKR